MNKSNLHSGFSIIEVLVSMSIIAIVIGASIGIVGNSLKMTRTAQTDAQAQAFAKSYLDTVKALWNIDDNYRFDQLPLIGTAAYPPPAGYTYRVRVYPYTPTTSTPTLGTTREDYTYSSTTAPSLNAKGAAPLLMKAVRLDVTQTSTNRVSSFWLSMGWKGNTPW